MQCQACGFEYYHNCASSVAAIIAVKNGILLTIRNHAPKKGTLDLPGGFCMYGESLENALEREIKEEINLDLAHIEYFGSFPNVYKYKGVTYFTIDAIFTCTTPDFSKAITCSEIADLQIINPRKIDLASVGFPSTRTALARFLRPRNSRRYR